LHQSVFCRGKLSDYMLLFFFCTESTHYSIVIRNLHIVQFIAKCQKEVDTNNNNYSVPYHCKEKYNLQSNFLNMNPARQLNSKRIKVL